MIPPTCTCGEVTLGHGLACQIHGNLGCNAVTGFEADLLRNTITTLTTENRKLKERVGEWISVEDRLPPKGTPCLLLMKNGDILIGQERYGTLGEPSRDEWAYRANCCGRYVHIITHWMPLPSPPEINQTINREGE